MAKLVPHSEGATCHHKEIPEGHGKFVIKLVFEREAKSWGYDAEKQSKDCYITWPLKDCRRRVPKAVSSSKGSAPTSRVNFYVDEGEGMMDGHAKTITEENIKHGRKRVRKPATWKSAKKLKYNKGSEGRKTGPQCKCRAKCREMITDEARQKIFEEYLDLKSIDRRRDFHCRYVKQIPTERSRVRKVLKDGTKNVQGMEEGSRRTLSRVYYLGEVKVCKKMYLNTLQISMQTIDTAFKKQGSVVVTMKDNRGGNNPKKENERELIRKHIKLFPIKDSHYCRKHNYRRYLHEKLSVAKMYKLYKVWIEKQGLKPEKIHMYSQVFNEDFNLDFFKRKKDKCALCNALENLKLDSNLKRLIFREQDFLDCMELSELQQYDILGIDLLHDKDGQKEKLPPKGEEEGYLILKYSEWKEKGAQNKRQDSPETAEEDDELDEEQIKKELIDMAPEDVFVKWRLHLYNVEITRQLKRCAKSAATKDKEYVYCCFDLQQVLECPYSNVGDLFYKRCLSSYNFVVNDTIHAYCFYWSQDEGKRGANEICTGLKLFGEAKAREGVKHIVSFADGCGGQGKNRMVAATLSFVVKTTTLESWSVCWLEKGHTENAADDVHSLIERAKITTVNVPAEWPTLMRQVDTKLVMKVKHLYHNDFVDSHEYAKGFSNFKKNSSGEVVVNWKTVKAIRLCKEDPFTLHYKMSYNQTEYDTIDMVQIGGKRGTSRVTKNISSNMKKAYHARIPIAAAKYDDLQELCSTLVIPKEYHDFYRDLPVETDV